MRIPDFEEFIKSVDIGELQKLAEDKTQGLKTLQFNPADSAAVNDFFNQYRNEIFDSDERLTLAYLSLYHRWLQRVLEDERETP